MKYFSLYCIGLLHLTIFPLYSETYLNGNIFEGSMVLNTRLGLNININPDLFNSQALDYKFPIRIDTSEKAIESYQEGLKKLNIQLVKKGSKYFLRG